MDDTWLVPLAAGDAQAAWDAFLERYRRLIFAAVRHCTSDPDDVMDVFTYICAEFCRDDYARLRRCAARHDPGHGCRAAHRLAARRLARMVAGWWTDRLLGHTRRRGGVAVIRDERGWHRNQAAHGSARLFVCAGLAAVDISPVQLAGYPG
jgi:hypothetical protein